MKKSTRKSRRHKNPQTKEDNKTPFFPKTNDTSIQTKEDPFFQPKLTVGQPGDKYEQEADAVAEAVVNNSNNTPAIQQKNISSIQRSATNAEKDEKGTNTLHVEDDKMIQEKPIQKMEGEEEEPVQMMEEEESVQMMEEEEESLQAKEEEEPVQMMEEEEPLQAKEEEEEILQTKSNSSANNSASPQVAKQLKQSKGGGSAMPKSTQSEMESSFGVDFSQVKIHTNDKAVQMNKDLGAQAFTHGKDVYFNKGKFSPTSKDGKKLLAHELTHVVQQTKEKNTPQVQGFFGKIWKGVKKGAKWVGNKVAGGISKIGKGLGWVGKKIWQGAKWLGIKSFRIIKSVGKYLYRVGESALGFIWTLVSQFPKRMYRLLIHLGQLLVSVPLSFWKGIQLLFSGNFRGFGTFIWDSFKGGLAWVGRLITKALDLLSFGELMDLVWTIIKFNTRKLTGVEESEARKVFGNSIDLWRVRIDEASFIAWVGKKLGAKGGGEMGVTTFHHINFSRKINAAPGNSDMAWLIHELVHVAQMENAGIQYMGEAIHAQNTSGYGYGGGGALVGKKLKDFNREQQGDIIKDAYNLVIFPKSGLSHKYAIEYQSMISDLRAGNL